MPAYAVSASSFCTVFQLRAVPGVPRWRAISAAVSLDSPRAIGIVDVEVLAVAAEALAAHDCGLQRFQPGCGRRNAHEEHMQPRGIVLRFLRKRILRDGRGQFVRRAHKDVGLEAEFFASSASSAFSLAAGDLRAASNTMLPL